MAEWRRENGDTVFTRSSAEKGSTCNKVNER